VLRQFIAQKVTNDLRRGRGRRAKPDCNVYHTLRLDHDVLEAYRRQGPGWQALMSSALRQHYAA
jgi:uncharacterized protein (DUF4415 family)